MWTADPDAMSAFETATWQRPQRKSSVLATALIGSETRWLAADADIDEPRLGAIARAGLTTAVLVPVRDGRTPVAVLELLTRTSVAPDQTLVAAIEAVALQLGHFWHLLSAGAHPTWRLGRL
jgi:hypothetical protein